MVKKVKTGVKKLAVKAKKGAAKLKLKVKAGAKKAAKKAKKMLAKLKIKVKGKGKKAGGKKDSCSAKVNDLQKKIKSLKSKLAKKKD